MNNKFFTLPSIKNLLLFNLYDVDEFVLREVESIKSSNSLDAFDVSKAKRYSYEIFRVGEDECEESEISTEEYLYRIEHGDGLCFTKLNYEDFEKEFPLNELDFWYGWEWLYLQHEKAFFQSAIQWIENTSGDASKKLRLRDLLHRLNGSYKSLASIKPNFNNPIPLNPIQEAVIRIFKSFDKFMIESFTSRYQSIFPELFNVNAELSKKQPSNVLLSKNVNVVGESDNFKEKSKKSDPVWFQVARFISTIKFEHSANKFNSDFFYYVNNVPYSVAKDASRVILSLGLDIDLDAVRRILTETFDNNKSTSSDIFYKSHRSKLSQMFESLANDENLNKWMFEKFKFEYSIPE